MNRQRYARRVREDAQTWRDRLIGRRIITSDPEIAAYEGWKMNRSSDQSLRLWEPRVFFCQPVGEGLDKGLRYEKQDKSPLLNLPAEIRNHILKLVVSPEMVSQKFNVDGVEQGDAVWLNTSAVIFTCKQLYVEARPIAIAEHTFPYEKFSRKTRLCAVGNDGSGYIWDLLNVVCDMNTNVIKQVYYR